MTSEIQSIQFLKEKYPKDRAIGWLNTNRFHDGENKLRTDGKYWVYDIRPTKQFRPGSFVKRPVGEINFVYGTMEFKIGKYRDRGKHKLQEKGVKRKTPLVDAVTELTKYLTEATKESKAIEDSEIGSGIQSVRVPKEWGLPKAREWVDNKGWTPDFHGRSPYTESDRWYRFRQYTPHKGDEYRIKTLPNKVQLVVDFKL